MSEREDGTGRGGVGRLLDGAGLKILGAIVGAILVPFLTSMITTSYRMGDADARLRASEAYIVSHKEDHKHLDLRQHAKDFEALEASTDADHDLIIRIGANIEIIRAHLAREKKP